MSARISVLGRVVCAAVCLSLVSTLSAASTDSFGTGTNQFNIDFVTISGDAGDLGSWSAGSGYTFTGVNRDDYRMGTYEVTNDQWDKFKASLGVPVTGTPANAYDYDRYWPIMANNVSWYEAAQFVNWLNTEAGHQPAYKFTGTQGTGDYTLDTWSAAEADNGTNLYRHKDAFYYLPTEDEWVKAGYWNGTSLQTYSNASSNDLVSGDPDPKKWNYNPSGIPSGGRSYPWEVGSGSEELNGTFDIMGNVREWMESPYSDTSYRISSRRGVRGGSYLFEYNTPFLASSSRGGYYPYLEYINVGFRVASEVPASDDPEVPEPATMLAGLAGLAGIGRYFRRR